MPDTVVEETAEPAATQPVLPPSPMRLLGSGLVVLVAVVLVVLLVGGLNQEGDTPPTVGDSRTRPAAARIDRLLEAVTTYSVETLPPEVEANLAATVQGVDEELADVRVTRVLAQDGRGVAIAHIYRIRAGNDGSGFTAAAAGTATTRETTVSGQPAVLIDHGEGQLSVAFVENGVGAIVQGTDETSLLQVAGELRNAARATT